MKTLKCVWGLLGVMVLVGCQVNPVLSPVWELADQRRVEFSEFATAQASESVQLRRDAVLLLGRIGGKESFEPIKMALKHSDPQVRKNAVLALGISGVSLANDELRNAFFAERTMPVKKEILLAVGNVGGEGAFDFLNAQLKDRELSGHAAQGLGLLLTWHREKPWPTSQLDFDTLLKLTDSADQRAEQAAFLISRVDSLSQFLSESKLMRSIKHTQSERARALLLKAWGRTSEKTLWRDVLAYLNSSHLGTRLEAIRAMQSLADNSFVGDRLLDIVYHQQPALAATALESLLEKAQPKIRDQALLSATQSGHVWLQGVALDHWIGSDPKRALAFIETLQPTASRYLLVKAINGIHTINPSDKPQRLQQFIAVSDPLVNRAIHYPPEQEIIYPASKTPRFEEVQESLSQKIKITTQSGEWIIQLLPDAPFTAHNFKVLVASGYYNGTVFSRVIPNFVAQGGESHGDGTGNVRYSIREEINELSHQPGTVGMATSGKDTGGAQFFVNLAPNYHLDRHYTIFGKIIAGWEIVESLTMGEQIISAEVID